MGKVFIAVFFSLAIVVAAVGTTVTHGLVLAVRPPFTQDSQTAIVNGGTTQRAVTVAGVWTFNLTPAGSDWPIQLNGSDITPNHSGNNAIQLYILNSGNLYQLTSVGSWYQYTGTLASWTAVSDPRFGAQQIVSVSPMAGSFTSGAGSANAAISTEVATMSPASPSFAGTWSLAGGVAVVTLTNGPPNIPNASPCTTKSCAWMPANAPSGSHVSLVFADMTPISADYTGAFSLSGPNASNFSISTSSVAYTDSFNNSKTRNVGEIKTSGALPAGDYSITVSAGASSQNVTVHSAACNSTPSPGGGAIPTSGTVCFGAGTYNPNAAGGSQVSNLSGILLGIGNGATIIDGNNTACGGVNQNNSFSGGAVIGIQFQNYRCDTNQGYPILTYIGMVVRNNRIINSNGAAVTIQGDGGFVANNLMDNMGYSGMTATMNGNSGSPTNIIGNEISRGNTGDYDTCNDAATIKYLPNFSTIINFTNNYIHDSTGPGPWPDTAQAISNISGNTIVRIGGEPGTILIEQTRTGTTIDHNVLVHNTDGSHFPALYCDSSAPVGAPPPYCGSGQCVFPSGDQGGGAAINVQGGANVNTHDNNISASSVSYPSAAFLFGDEIGNGTGFVGGNTFHDNTVNFFSRSSQSVVGFVDSTENTSGSSTSNNHYHLIGGNTSTDAHWYWFGQGNTAKTFTNYRASGQDAGATVDTTDTSTTGCMHVACSGSGIGAGGVPLLSSSGGQFVINSTTGVLSVGAVDLVAGTYTAEVVATQSGAASSPYHQVVTITGSAGGGVPAVAAVAGFNTLIINDNFQSATFANPVSNWLDCNDGSTPPASPLYYRSWVGFGMNISVPCSQITQATDPVGGQLALRLHNQDSFRDLTNGHSMAALVQTVNDSGNGRPISQGHYVEVVARTDNATGGSPNPWMGLWSYTTSNSSNGGYELDGFEESGTGGTAAIHNNFAAPGQNNCPGQYCSCANADQACDPGNVDVTQYQTYAWRQTGNGSDIVMCAYVNGVRKGACNTIAPGSPQLSPGSPMTVQLFNTGATNPLNNGSTGKNVWVKSLKVWSCDTNPNNLCHSSSANP